MRSAGSTRPTVALAETAGLALAGAAARAAGAALGVADMARIRTAREEPKLSNKWSLCSG